MLQNDYGRILLLVDVREAVEPLREALEATRKRIAADEWDSDSRLRLCEISINLSTALKKLSRDEEALEVTEGSMPIAEALLRDFPRNDAYQTAVNSLRVNHAVGLSQLDRREESLEVLGRAIEDLEQLVQRAPNTPGMLHRLGAALSNQSAILQEMARLEEALEPLRRAVEYHQQALAIEPDSPPFRYHYAVARLNTGCAELAVADHAAASEHFLEAAPMLAGDPSAVHFLATQWMQAALLAERDEALEEDERMQVAEGYREEALATLEGALESGTLDAERLETEDIWEPLRFWPEFEELIERAR
jgi:tetratricopeptide (TPR) repeat protein